MALTRGYTYPFNLKQSQFTGETLVVVFEYQSRFTDYTRNFNVSNVSGNSFDYTIVADTSLENPSLNKYYLQYAGAYKVRIYQLDADNNTDHLETQSVFIKPEQGVISTAKRLGVQQVYSKINLPDKLETIKPLTFTADKLDNVEYRWVINGSVYTKHEVEIVFAEPGTYEAKLTVTENENGSNPGAYSVAYRVFEVTGNSQPPLILEIDTSISGILGKGRFTLPIEPTDYTGQYYFVVDWGDGTTETFTDGGNNTTHLYPENKKYTVTITGLIDGFSFGKTAKSKEPRKLTKVKQWGSVKLGDTDSHFAGCVNMEITAEDAPDLSKTTSLRKSFSDCNSLTSPSGISLWDTSTITTLFRTFQRCYNFKGDISTWDVSNVTSLSGTFIECRNFNVDISGWDTSSVTTLYQTFKKCRDFNQPVGKWDIKGVTTLYYCFSNCEEFNQPLNDWDTSSLSITWGCFNKALKFNQPLDKWDTSGVTDMDSTFEGAASFQQDISMWNFDSNYYLYSFIKGTAMTPNLYGKLLIAWSNSTMTYMSPSNPNIKYPDDQDVIDARNDLINNQNFSITDGGKV